MSNQIIMWSLFIIPWLTLFFMKKDDRKRYMSAGLFAALTSVIILELGVTTGLWEIRETAYPLAFIPAFIYGANLIVPMWVLKFTYGRFWLYFFTNAVIDIGFAFGLFSFYANRGIFIIGTFTSYSVYIINFVHAFTIYGYQIWQEGIFARLGSEDCSQDLQPASVKHTDTEG